MGSETGNGFALRRKQSPVEVSQGPSLQGLLSSAVEGPRLRQVTIRALPDDVLLEIFSLYLYVLDWRYPYELARDRKWRTLVRVCRRWRNVVFSSPHRLDLRLLCTATRPAKEMLDIWPALPISIEIWGRANSSPPHRDNIMAALEHNDRICQITFIWLPSSLLEQFAAAMQEPLPALTSLKIGITYESKERAPVFPGSFLGGSAPRLQLLELIGISFSALPKLLLSATGLVDLRLRDIPHSGYISPQAMVACLSAPTRLEFLLLEFHSPRSRPDRTSPPPLGCTVLPALTKLYFHGPSEYLEDLISRIDVPLLHHIDVTFFNQLILRTPQLVQFLSRTGKLSTLNRASLTFSSQSGQVVLNSRNIPDDHLWVSLNISFREREWQFSSLAQICTAFLTPLSTLEHLEVSTNRLSNRQDDDENTQWLEILRPFIGVKNLSMDTKAVSLVAPALQELVGEAVTDMLPALQNLFIRSQGPNPSTPVPEAVEQFAAARQLAGHPVAVHVEESTVASEESGQYHYVLSKAITAD
ncbi:hypothetical protein BJV74DRAFT_991205 [Russula compacta]|nr:hypothetical protein BJV74DRAFT_991205 [Russula compacta]